MFGIIKGFYPSVKDTLLIKTIIFAKKHRYTKLRQNNYGIGQKIFYIQ